MDNFEEFKTNVYADTAVIQLISDLFLGVAYLDVDTIRENLSLAYSEGAPEELRTINANIADYLLNNMGVIFMGLIINEDFRDVFVEAVSIECSLDCAESKKMKEVRDKMKIDDFEHFELSDKNLVIDLENYDKNVFCEISRKLSESFKKVGGYGDAVDMLINELSDRAMMDIGFCASNFMYAFRAFAKDQVFFEYVRKVLESVKSELEL